MNINMMNRNITNLIQITWNVNNLFKQSHNIIVQRLIRTTQHELLDNGKKRRRRLAPTSILPVSPYNYEDSGNEWKNCTNHYDVFSQVKQRHGRLTAVDASMALDTLFKINKDYRINPNITKLEEFDTLCQVLKNDMRTLSLNHIINALKCLNYFKVPSSAVVIQMLLQLIRHSINQLSMDQGIFLIHLLPKLQKTPLVEALMIALPLVLHTNVKTKIDTENIHSLIAALEYFSKNTDIDESILLLIMDSLKKLREQSINTANALKLLFVLLQLNDNLISKELLSKVYDILTQSIYDVHNTSLLPILLHKISSKVKSSGTFFYNASFIDACVSRIISERPKIENIMVIVEHLNSLFHSNIEIINYIVDKSIETQYFVENTKIQERMNIMTAMSITNEKPSSWELLQESILIDRLLDLSHEEKVKLTTKLLSLNIYWPKLLENIFDSYNNEKLNPRFKKQLLIIHYTLKKFYPQYYGPFLLDEDIDLFQALYGIKNIDPLLLHSLKSILGGQQYVLQNLQTQYGEFIDFTVIMRKGGYPVALNNTEESKPSKLEDLEIPKDSQVFLFLSIGSKSFALNTRCLTPSTRLLHKLVETNPNYTVINIFSDQWSSLSESARLKYLSDVIKLKTNQESIDVSC